MSSAVASVASASVIAPSIAASSVAHAEASPADPIFAAIEHYLAAERECNRIQDEEEYLPEQTPRLEAASYAVVAARLRLARTAPTTLVGLAALARFLNHQSNVVFETSFFDEELAENEVLPFYASLDRALTALTAAGPAEVA